jgi:zinc protease
MAIKNSIALAALLLSVPLCLNAQNQKQKGRYLPLDSAVRTGKLPNGFTYYIRHNAEPKHRVYLYMVNKAGSVLEDEDQRGLAHFMEHMSFNGTVHFPHNELVNYLQKAGIRFGADINAYTSFDETVYELPLPSDKPEILNEGILIMHDWAQSATLDPVEIDKERGVVLEEKRLGKGADERMQRQYWPVIFNNSRYAVRIPIGLDTVLDNFKRPVIARFYHDWYRPDLQALIVVGDINADSLEQVVKRKFADLKNPVHERNRIHYTVLLRGQNHFIAVTDKEMTGTEAEVIIKHPGNELKSSADFRKDIIKNLFNAMLSERFAELSRQPKPPFVQGSAGIGNLTGGLSMFDASTIANPGELEKGFKAVWRETERVKRFGFTATELERAKQDYLSNLEDELAEKNKTSSETFVHEYQANFLKGTAAPGIVAEYRLSKNDLPGITIRDVNDLASAYIIDANRDILILAPEKDKSSLPDEATVNNWMNEVQQEKLQPYKDEVSDKPLLAIPPNGGRIVSLNRDTALGITKLELSNGVKIILKPTNFKNDQILFTAFSPGGNSLASNADYQSAAHAASIVAAGGAGNYNAIQLDKYLSGKELSVRPYINERTQGIQGFSTPKDFETALKLIMAYLTEPRKDDTVFEAMLSQSKAGLANRDSNPKSVFSDTVSAVLGDYNIRRTGPSIAKLNEINLDKAYGFYKQRFDNADGMTFLFVGNIDLEKMKPLLAKYLGSLPSTSTHSVAKDLGIHIPEGVITKNVYKGSEPQSTVLLVFSGKLDYSQENNIKLDALKESLEIRLLERLREDESGVYSPGVFVSTTKYPEARYSFIIQFGCAPQNVDKLIASALDEVTKLRNNGPLQQNLDKWRAEDKNSRETKLQTNSFWLSYFDSQLENKEPLEQISKYAPLRDQVSTEDLKAMAAKCLSGNNFIRLVLIPASSALKTNP